MKIAGFSFIRNAVKYDYPIVEAIESVLPLCDKFFLAIGKSEDETEALIKTINSEKLVIIHTEWDDSLRKGGRVLALETDKAFQAIPGEYDWAFYIQGDEVFHEDGATACRAAMQKYLNDASVQGLLFKYRHFYGSYDYVGTSSRWYRKEVRIVRNDKNIFSWKDAQGFRYKGDQKLNVKQVDAYIHHYGWVKQPEAMQQKQLSFNKLWHDDEWVNRNVVKADRFDYSGIDALELFKGTHPSVMKARIERINWKFSFDLSFNRLKLKDKFRNLMEKVFGFRPFEYRNYKLRR